VRGAVTSEDDTSLVFTADEETLPRIRRMVAILSAIELAILLPGAYIWYTFPMDHPIQLVLRTVALIIYAPKLSILWSNTAFRGVRRFRHVSQGESAQLRIDRTKSGDVILRFPDEGSATTWLDGVGPAVPKDTFKRQGEIFLDVLNSSSLLGLMLCGSLLMSAGRSAGLRVPLLAIGILLLAIACPILWGQSDVRRRNADEKFAKAAVSKAGQEAHIYAWERRDKQQQ